MLRNNVSLAFGALFATLTIASSASAQISPPYTQNFDSLSTCGTSCGTVCNVSSIGWTNVSVGDSGDWLVRTGSTGSSSTGPSSDHTLGNSLGRYLYTEASGCSFSSRFLLTPPIDLTTATFPAARFWYHMYGSNMGTMHIDILDDMQSVLQLGAIPSLNDNINLWQQSQEIDLVSYVGQTIYIRFRGITGNSFRSDMAIDDFELYQNFANDVGVASVDSLNDDCGLGQVPLTITLVNGGGNAQSNFTVEYSLDGGAPVVETFTGTLTGGASTPYTFATPVDLSVVGPHTVSVTVTLAGDENIVNDNVMTNVFNGAVINALPSLDDFEAGNPNLAWRHGGSNSSWELGTPAGTIINAASSGAGAWVTNLSGNYNFSESSFVETRHCYDFTGVGAPAASLMLWYETESGSDGAVLQSSVDNGNSWQTIGAVDDPTNWYNDDNIFAAPGGQFSGWSGSSGAWLMADHAMFNLSNAPSVRFRLAFASNGGTQLEGVALDDFAISALINDDLRVAQVGPTSGTLVTYQPGASDVIAQVLELLNYGPTASLPIDGITITNNGTLPDADVLAVKLWADDGDGVFDPASDTLEDTQLLAAGTATFTSTTLSAPNVGTQRVFITYDIGPNAAAGATFGSQIAMPQTDIVSSMAESISVMTPPLDGPLLFVGAIVNTLPFVDDFSASQPNRSVAFQAGTVFPQASQAGGGVSFGGPSFNDAQVELLASNGGLTPVEGTMFYAASFPDGFATAALDYSFDLGAFSVANDTLWLQYRFTDVGEENNSEDNIFISLDGGNTWTASLHRFIWNNPQGTWLDQSIDVTQALADLGADYTNDVVVRFQNADNQALNGDGFLLDRVFLGRPMLLQVTDPAAAVLDDGTVELLGDVPQLLQTRSYTITNTGDLPMSINLASFQVSNASNVMGLTISPPANPVIDPGMSETFVVEFTPELGPFSFNLSFSADVPNLDDNIFDIVVNGLGQLALPEIDIADSDGSLPDGSTDVQSDVSVGELSTLSYTISNTGFTDLYITSATIRNPDNVTAAVTTTPAEFTPVGQTTTVGMEFSADSAGPYSFDLVVGTNDFDEPFYTITVAGAASADGGSGGAGGAGGMAAGGMGPTTSSSTGGTGGQGGDDPIDDDGCSCRMAGAPSQPSGPAGALGGWLLLLAFGLRRRRAA